MKSRVAYWIMGLMLLGLGSLGCWQQWQQQQRMHSQLQVLDATLQVANERAQADVGRILHDMQLAIRRNQKQPQDVLLLHQTERLCQRADSTIKRIRRLRNELMRVDSRVSQAGETTVQNTSEKVADANEQAENVVSSFIKMVQWMSPIDEKLARLHRFTIAKSHSQGLFYRSQSSLPEALALLTQKEAIIREYELMALAFQNQKMGCGLNIVFDKVGAFAAAESNTVAAGELYKAELFLTSSSAKLASQMTVNGKPIAIGADGRGHVEFRVPGDAGKALAAQAYWIGTIRTLVNGRDSIFKVRVPYAIRSN